MDAAARAAWWAARTAETGTPDLLSALVADVVTDCINGSDGPMQWDNLDAAQADCERCGHTPDGHMGGYCLDCHEVCTDGTKP